MARLSTLPMLQLLHYIGILEFTSYRRILKQTFSQGLKKYVSCFLTALNYKELNLLFLKQRS